jgi:hypothetical protein
MLHRLKRNSTTISRGRVFALWFLGSLLCFAAKLEAQESDFREACERIYGTGEVRPDLRKLHAPSSLISTKVTVDALIRTDELLIGRLDIKNTCAVHERLLKRLRGLNISSYQLSDLRPLRSLVLLEELELNNNRITDITSLATLRHLKAIDLSANEITDLTPLSTLPELVEVRLAANKISDVSPLKSLETLERLHLEQNRIVDISSLSGMTSLAFLFLDNNQIESIKVLGELPALRDVSLNGNRVRSGDDFTCSHQIKIDISNNPIAHDYDERAPLMKKVNSAKGPRQGIMLETLNKPYVLSKGREEPYLATIRTEPTTSACLVYKPPMHDGKVVVFFPICQIWPPTSYY